MLPEEEKKILYLPRKHLVIVKFIGKKVSRQFLKSTLIELRKPTENLVLIDLGWDFSIAKFLQQENKKRALHDGPWFLIGVFLSVQQWVLNFTPQESSVTHSAI